MEKVELTECRAYESAGRVYLCLRYSYENEKGLYEVIYPKIDLDILTFFLPSISQEISSDCEKVLLNTPSGNHYNILPVKYVDGKKFPEGCIRFTKCIEEKVHEMTLSEIEKKLGYKVKVVSDKKNQKVRSESCIISKPV